MTDLKPCPAGHANPKHWFMGPVYGFERWLAGVQCTFDECTWSGPTALGDTKEAVELASAQAWNKRSVCDPNEVALAEQQADERRAVIAEFRDVVATIYAFSGEDPQIANLCDPLLTKYGQDYLP